MRLHKMLAAGFLVLALWTISSAAADEYKHVLILNSYHRGFSWSDEEESGVIERLRGAYPTIETSVEYLDSKRFPDMKNQEVMKDFLVDKYRGAWIDLVVAIDDPALALLTRYRDELFPGVSVVFAGVSDYRRYLESGRGKITGVVEKQDVQNTLETALSFHPEAKTVLVINDNTVSGVSTRRDAEALRPLFAGRVDIRFLPPSTFDEARTAIGELPPDAIVLIHSYSTDRVGKALSTRETTRLVVTAANIPVYTLHKHRLGDGVVGGFLLDGEKHGRMAADLAIRVLMGMDASTIPVEDTSTSRPMFDFVQLKRFGIPLDKLPPAASSSTSR